MWQYLVRFILRNRLAILIVIGLLTVFMGFEGSKVKLSYELAKMLPSTDPTSIEYNTFKKEFGQTGDGSVTFVAVEDPNLFTLSHFTEWYNITQELRKIKGVKGVTSAARVFSLVRNDSLHKFQFKNLVPVKPTTQQQVDSIRNVLYDLPMYANRLYNKENHVHMIMITVDKNILNSKKRIPMMQKITETVNQYGQKFHLDIRYSGLPYIRTIQSKLILNESYFFILLSAFITFVLLFFLFRSFRAVFFAMVVVIVAVIWTLGSITLLGYKFTILTGVLPPLLIVIGVENSIFLLNKYLDEIRQHGNKTKALSRMIIRIGKANFLTNATTAVGFGSFIITSNTFLVEFGIVATINILVIYVLSMLLLPILFSYFPVPKAKHMRHLENEKGFTSLFVRKVTHVVLNYRTIVYVVTITLVLAGIYGATRLRTTGSIVDDLSKNSKIRKDLRFFEKNFKGVMPLEITINTEKPNGVLRLTTLRKINELQNMLAQYPEFAQPVSIVEIVKAAKQAFYRGNPKMYTLPNSQEKNFIMSYIPDFGNQKNNLLNSFVDSNYQIARVSVQMENVGTNEIDSILRTIRPKIDKIFPPAHYKVHLTGTSVVFLKSTNYLVKNLFTSLLLAIIAITLLMSVIFSSVKMILVSLIPNAIPLILTAGMMGYFGISIKPSTIIIFSIALGISVDNTIHFLSRYRLHLKSKRWKIKESVLATLQETGHSMIFSAIVLFFGFFIFTLSSFGGTQALGYLVSITLLVALFTNLIVLPSLLITLNKWLLTPAFKRPGTISMDNENEQTKKIEKIVKEELDKKDQNP
ncbi:MAG: MMPL family transporter [Bacteroidales bacterium]|nr:MMPL family transporter [Bacteroidales bacterium]